MKNKRKYGKRSPAWLRRPSPERFPPTDRAAPAGPERGRRRAGLPGTAPRRPVERRLLAWCGLPTRHRGERAERSGPPGHCTAETGGGKIIGLVRSPDTAPWRPVERGRRGAGLPGTAPRRPVEGRLLAWCGLPTRHRGERVERGRRGACLPGTSPRRPVEGRLARSPALRCGDPWRAERRGPSRHCAGEPGEGKIDSVPRHCAVETSDERAERRGPPGIAPGSPVERGLGGHPALRRGDRWERVGEEGPPGIAPRRPGSHGMETPPGPGGGRGKRPPPRETDDAGLPQRAPASGVRGGLAAAFFARPADMRSDRRPGRRTAGADRREGTDGCGPPALRRGGRTTAARLPGRAGRRAPDAVSGERRRPERSPPSPAARRTRGPVEGAARSGAAPSGSPRGGRPQRFRDGPRGRGDSAARPAEVEGREPGGGGARSERRRNERSGPGPWVPALRPAGVGAPPCRQSGGGPRRERDRDRERETRPRPCPPEGDGERLPG